jgi:hypothetical protein
MINALFVEKNGVYSSIPGVDVWDIERDAMLFRGNAPVVAHPPCNLWGRFAIINYERWGGVHNIPRNDGGMFGFALSKVRSNCGVLEHPAHSYAWDAFRLVKPLTPGWNYCGRNEYVCEVWQSAYGHRARKKTWLLYCGEKPFELRWDKIEGTHQIGFHDQRGNHKNKPTISGKKASETPIQFRDELIRLATINL